MVTPSPSRQRPNLLTLPQELQDLIFGFAYPAEPAGTVYRTPQQWRQCQNNLRLASADHEILPMPALKTETFLVSKRFFVSAARAWVRNQEWDCRISQAEHRRLARARDFYGQLNLSLTAFGKLGGREAISGIVPAFVREVTVESKNMRNIHMLSGLKVLRVLVGSEVFRILEPDVVAWRDSLSPEQLEKVVVGDGKIWSTGFPTGVLAMPGLQRIELLPGSCSYARTDHAKAVFATNVGALETFLKLTSKVGSMEKVVRGLLAGGRRGSELYSGSKVRFVRSW